MNQLRIHGDPFGDDGPACLLRSFLRQALGGGMRCALALVEGREVHAATRLPPAEVELLLRAAGEAVAASAPVVVFASGAERDLAVRAAGLRWPRAAVVLPAREDVTAAELLQRVRAELRWAGSEDAPHALAEAELAPWLALPLGAGGGPIVGVGDVEFGSGLDLLVAAWRRHLAPAGIRLRLVVPGAQPAALAGLRHALGPHGAAAEFVTAPFAPAHVGDAAAIVLPWHRCASLRPLVQALASGRPVLASRFAATAPLLDRPGCCLPLGGDNVADEAGHGAHFAPAAPALVAALHTVATGAFDAVAMGRTARTFVVEELVRGRPSPPPRPLARNSRPVVVLESPLFDGSPAAAFVLASARELVHAGRVDLHLVARPPFGPGLAALGEAAPELAARLCRDPGVADVWLSAGSPTRSARPACRTWVLQLDATPEPLPLELTPHVTQDADLVVVPDERMVRLLAAAGRSAASVVAMPFGGPAAAAVIEDVAAGRWRAAPALTEPVVELPRGDGRRAGVPQPAGG